MKQKLLIATGNPGKFKEIKTILEDLPFKFVSLQDLGLNFEFKETGGTHQENALLKARFFAEKTNLPTLADDSGLVVPVLKGELGLFTRRFGKGEQASDREWVKYFLEKMKSFKGEKRRAKFFCSAALVWPGKGEWAFEGEALGIITETLEAPVIPGLPLSSCFKPDGFFEVYAVLSRKEKGKISHRGVAINKVRDFLIKEIKAGRMAPS